MLSKLLTTLRSALVCTLPLLATASMAQTTINVGPGQPYSTIQSGINAANNGDTVLVAPGTYYENINFKGKAITVTSAACSGPNPATTCNTSTIIDGGNTDATVTFNSTELRNSVISGFTIRNGGYGSNSSQYAGGGIYVSNAGPTILNNLITANNCHAIQVEFGAALIQNNTLSGTFGTTDCFFDGSGVVLGGNAQLSGLTHSSLIGNIIENNLHAHSYDGGGIALWAAEGTVIQGNIIRNNATTGGGGAIVSYNTVAMTIVGNLIYGNRASTDGAIQLAPPDDSVGAFIGILASNTIYGNKQTASLGGEFGDVPPSEVYLSGNLGQYLLVNNIIVGDGPGTLSVSCGTIYNYLTLTPLVFDHNDIYNPGGSSYGGACTDQTGIYGNIATDPKLSNPSGGDFTLSSGSPAIDTGNNSAPQMLPSDLAGNVRIQDATSLGYPVIDMGAYEFQGLQDKAPTILTLTPSEYFYPQSYGPPPNSPLTFTSTLASAAGTPSGPVTIYVDNAVVTTISVGTSGTATFSIPGLKPGLHAFTSTYPGSGIFPPAVSVKFYLIIPTISTTLKLTSSPNSSILGSPVTFTVTASAVDNSIPSPITLTDTSTNTLLTTLTPNSAGIATFSISTLTLGYHFITAAFVGNSTYSSASASVDQQVVNGYTTALALTCSPASIPVNSTALLTATVSSAYGTPTGSIAWTDNGATLSTQSLSAATTTLTYTGPNIGIHTLTATYVPTGVFAPSSASCSESVTPLPTTSVLAVSTTTSTFGAPVILTATVAPASPPGPSTPTGSVTFFNGTSAVASASLVNGIATAPVNRLPGGTDNVTCTYGGDSIYATSNCNTIPVLITAAPTTTTLTVSPNPAYFTQPVTMTATVTETTSVLPIGTITFSDGITPLSTQILTGGTARYTTSTLSVGTHPITATYNPTGTSFATSTSPLVNEVILPSSFTIALSPSTITLPPGASGTVAIQLTSVGNFAGPLTLSYGSLPAYATASITPTTVTLTAGGTGASTLTLNTLHKASNAIPTKPGSHQPTIVLALLLLLAPFTVSRRRKLTRFLGLALLLFGLQATTGCTNSWYTAEVVASGTYQLPITATDVSGNSQTATLTVIVTQ